MKIPKTFVTKSCDDKVKQLLELTEIAEKYNPPIFPDNTTIELSVYERVYAENLGELEQAYSRSLGLTGIKIREIGDEAGASQKIRTPDADGYSWFHGLYFAYEKGGFLILFPWMSINRVERHIEVYKQGTVPQEELETALENICKRLPGR